MASVMFAFICSDCCSNNCFCRLEVVYTLRYRVEMDWSNVEIFVLVPTGCTVKLLARETLVLDRNDNLNCMNIFVSYCLFLHSLQFRAMSGSTLRMVVLENFHVLNFLGLCPLQLLKIDILTNKNVSIIILTAFYQEF